MMNSYKWQLKEQPKKVEYIIDFDFLLIDIVLEGKGIPISSTGEVVGGEQVLDGTPRSWCSPAALRRSGQR